MAQNDAHPRQEAHALLDLLPPEKFEAVRALLEVLVRDEEELSEEDTRAVAASREYFRQGGEGRTMEEVAAECGITMDEIRGSEGG